ncbi:MAG: zinc-ribbon domain-containing protein [Chloroflexi bacterium]|nr:MAG: zinc-ribbon domain-containing protein [Chloroflexota bacterium]
MVTCPNCGNQASEGAIFCDQCGARLPAAEAIPGTEAAQAHMPVPAPVPSPVTEAGSSPEAAPAPGSGSVICPACGAGNVPGEAFCDYCGSPLDAPVPTPVEAPAAEAPLAAGAPAEAPAQPEGALAPAPAGELTCPACGAEVGPGEAFCQNCGASLAQAPLPLEAVEEPAAAVEEPSAAVEAPAVPVEEPIEQAVPAPTAPPAPAGVPSVAPPDAAATALNCPACGAEISPEDTFCSSCGFALKAVPAAQGAAPAPALAPTPMPGPVATPSAGGPRLVVSASGAEIPLPGKAEIVVGREDPVSGIYPDVDLTPHGGEEGGVSRRHARIVAEGGNYYVVDLDSTNFTFVNKQKLAPGTRQQVQPGEEIRFGRVAVVFRS